MSITVAKKYVRSIGGMKYTHVCTHIYVQQYRSSFFRAIAPFGAKIGPTECSIGSCLSFSQTQGLLEVLDDHLALFLVTWLAKYRPTNGGLINNKKL